MSVKYLYYTEDADTGGNLSAAEGVPWLDQFLYMYGGGRICIHPENADYNPSSDESYPTLEAAVAMYPDHQWIFLDHSAKTFLDEYPPNVDNVIYAVGHDAFGYGDSELPGMRVKLRTVFDTEGHAIPTLIAAICERGVQWP